MSVRHSRSEPLSRVSRQPKSRPAKDYPPESLRGEEERRIGPILGSHTNRDSNHKFAPRPAVTVIGGGLRVVFARDRRRARDQAPLGVVGHLARERRRPARARARFRVHLAEAVRRQVIGPRIGQVVAVRRIARRALPAAALRVVAQ